MKTVTMHQPNYLPWLGLFSKIAHSDCFVIVGDVQYTSNSVINRNKIRTKDGWTYSTVPVGRNHHDQRIYDVPLPRDKGWMDKHWKALQQNYVKADFFGQYNDFFKELYQKDFGYLWQLNMEIISYLVRCFEINTEVVSTSEMNLDPDLQGTDLIITIVEKTGADKYISGPSGKYYLDSHKFAKRGIDLRFFKFQHPVYEQVYPGFEPAMAAIDLLFNVGSQSAEVIRASGNIKD